MNKILSLVIVSVGLCLPAFGMYLMPELKDLPLERLIKNLTERTEAEPGNSDGVISGPELAALALWRDANADGISDPGEVRPVADYGITTLSTHGQPHDAGFPFCPKGVGFKDGTTRPTYDLILLSH